MSAVSHDVLLTTAKSTLGLPTHTPKTKIPKVYLEELANHLRTNSNDTNFKILLQPNKGFGVVTCLESKCANSNSKITLGPGAGGMVDGFGTLAMYRTHAVGSSDHRKCRDARVKSEGTTHASALKLAKKEAVKASTASTSTNTSNQRYRENMVDVKPVTTLDLKAKSLPARSHPLPLSTMGPVKPEPAEAVIPRKRHSNPESLQMGRISTDSHSSKKPKLEPSITPIPKTPLTLVSQNSLTIPPSLTISVEQARGGLEEVQRDISSAQTMYDRFSGKKRKGKGDMTRISNLAERLKRLNERKAKYHAALPVISDTVSHVAPPPARLAAPPQLKPEPMEDVKPTITPFSNFPPMPTLDRKPKFQFHSPIQQPVASGSGLRGPSLADNDNMDVDEDPVNPEVILNKLASVLPYVAPQLSAAAAMDENGDYHGRGRDTYQGPRAKADDINTFLREAGNAESFDGNASVDKCLVALGLADKFSMIPGMEVALMTHQLIGVAWMVEKEASSLKGGCLGDEMGLGKTVQAIALMVKNRSDDPLIKTNLILAPTALLSQWKLEIEMKTNCGLKCLIYHGATKPRTKKELLKYDVVITTYHTMSNEWPDAESEAKAKAKGKEKKSDVFIVSDSEDDSDNGRGRGKKAQRKMGLLFQVDWYRIITDEAQQLRNRRTRISRAVSELTATYRWCLTGTPIINSLTDPYAYIRFLKIRPWYDWTEFNEHVARYEKKRPDLAMSRLQLIFKTIMIRRMKTSELDGKRLIELPEKEVQLVKLEFTQEERDIYSTVEAKTQTAFNRFLRAGTVLKNYTQVLVLLLRLRQICCHPALIQENGVAFIAPEEVDEVHDLDAQKELSRARALVSDRFVAQMKYKFKEAAIRKIAAEESADAVIDDDDECKICQANFTNAVIAPCSHAFCRECILNAFDTPLPEDQNELSRFKENERPCPACSSPICAETLFRRSAFEPTDGELAGEAADETPDVIEISDDDSDVPKRSKGKGKGKAVAKKRSSRVVDTDDDSDDSLDDFIVDDDEDDEEWTGARRVNRPRGKKRAMVVSEEEEEEEDLPEEKEVLFGTQKKTAKLSKEQIKLMPRFLPSTKMKHMMMCIEQWAVTHPDEKVLVISQWTHCLQLVSDYLEEKGIGHVKYQGDMSRPKRDQAVRIFMAKDKARIMLMSQKCGGVGLNLTRGNRVISLDLGWSQAIENQAFDRVHRLGQTKKVEVQRLVISNTVEDRVLALQERKQNLADGSLGEGNGKKIGKLTVKDIAGLFGLDARGNVIQTEY